MNRIFISSVRNAVAFLVMAGCLGACNLGSYDDAVDRFNQNAPAPPPPPPPPPAGFGPNFSEIQANVFTPTCATANCHSAGGARANLVLEEASSYAELVGIDSTQAAGTQRVNPGNPNDSYLIQKLEGPGASGEQMPPGSPMDQADINVIRQWITDGAIDDRVPAVTPIRVTSLSPAPGANLDSTPAQIVAGFDRDLDVSTVNAMTFTLTASGGDQVFGDANDIQIAAASITVPGGNPRSAIFDLTGVALADDMYQVVLRGSGANLIMDTDGNALDGEYPGSFPSGDGTEGGDFFVQFSITTPVVIGPTLDQIQAVIFSPTCAPGCHSGGAPDGGLDLSDADTSHAALFNVASSGQAGSVRVVPFDPDNSYLIRKLEDAMGIAGNRMPPPPAQMIQQSDINEIRQWITDGAVR